MTDNTEPTIDEQIRLKLLSLINNLQDVWLEDKDSWYGAETTVPEILALISDQVAKARIDELIGVRGWTEYEPDPKYSPAERFHIVPYTYLTKRIEELKRSK